MSNVKRHIQHIKSNAVGKSPSGSDVMYGEIAVNYAANNETLWLKNSNNNVVPVGGVGLIRSGVTSSDMKIGSFTVPTYHSAFTAANTYKINPNSDNVTDGISKLDNKISALVNDVINDEEVIANTVDALSMASGFDDAEGLISYKPNESANFINNANSLFDADVILDSAIKATSVQTSILTNSFQLLNEKLSSLSSKVDGLNSVNVDNKTIKEGSDGIYAVDATIEQAFTTVGKVGNLNAGTSITAGTSIVEVLKRILVAVIDVVAVKPTVTMTISPSGTPLEVGSQVTITATCTYTDGRFTGATSSYSTNQAAGCTKGNITYTPPSGSAVTTASTSYTFSSYSIRLGNNTWKVKQAYGASTNTAKKNDNTNSSVKISASTTAEVSKTIAGQYKFFFGNYTNESVLSSMTITATSEEKGITLIKSDLISAVTSGETYTIYSSSYTPSGFKIYLAIPSIYEISSAKGSLGGEWHLSDNSKNLNYTHGGTTTEYKVYYYAGEKAQEITSLIIKKS